MANWRFARPSPTIGPSVPMSTAWWRRRSRSAGRSQPGPTTQSWRLRIVTNWRPAVERKEALREVEARLALEPDSVALRFERACLLNEMGRNEDAKQGYLDVLTRCPA